MATVIWGSRRITTGKDMEHSSGLMDRDTRGNTRRVTVTDMEYANTQMEQCIVENTIRATKMVMAVTGFHLAMKNTESTRMIRNMERES